MSVRRRTPAESESHGCYSILRIKRKRGAEPLSALFIEGAGSQSKKARRGEVPNEAAGIFRFAATVEVASFGDKAETQRLEDRITTLVRSSSAAAAKSSPITPAVSKEQRHARHRLSAAQARFRIVQERRNSVAVDGFDPEEGQRPSNASRTSYSRGLGRSRPPSTPFARIYDAVEEHRGVAEPTEARRSIPGVTLAGSDLPTSQQEVDAINSMLSEFLRVSDSVVHANGAGPNDDGPTDARAREHGAQRDDEDDESFVYDVYYRARTPSALEPITDAYGALRPYHFVDDMSGESDSGEAMTDDEDSNEEDFYRNDYPDDESSSQTDDEVEGWASEEADRDE